MVENGTVRQMPVGSPAGQSGGILQVLQEKIHFETLVEKLKLSKSSLVEVGVYGGIGFIIGFFFKRIVSYLVTFAIFATILILLQQLNFISFSFNWPYIYEQFGLQTVPLSNEGISSLIAEWLKTNVVQSISFVIGFLIGLKTG